MKGEMAEQITWSDLGFSFGKMSLVPTAATGGGDFQAVLEEIIHIAEPTVSVPRFEGKWTKAGAVDGDGWSVAWRTHDAQYWGVPQRRRRISVIADFGGQSAGEILFERKGLPGAVEPGEQERKRPAAGTQKCTAFAVRMRAGCSGGGKGPLVQTERCGSLMRNNDQTIFVLQGNIVDRDAACHGKGYKEDISYTLNTVDRHAVVVPEGVSSPTFRMNGYGDYCKSEIGSTLRSSGGEYGGGPENIVANGYARRLTPMECERLQGFPDGWTEIGEWKDDYGRTHKQSDSPRYKALGNSIALPFWYWMFCRMAEHLPSGATLGSLFDGIGGFPLCWESIHGKGTARWASEIDKFPIAVTKLRFPEEA